MISSHRLVKGAVVIVTPSSPVCLTCAVVHAAAQAQAQAEERRSLAGNSPGPAANAPARPQGCKPGKPHRAPAQNLRWLLLTVG